MHPTLSTQQPQHVADMQPATVRSAVNKQTNNQTNKQTRSQAKRWVFTLNNPLDSETVPEDLCDYAVVGEEIAPDTGTRHFQGFVCFKKQYLLSGVKKILPRAHWEVAKGTVAQNFTYCSKDGKFVEIGQRPSEQTTSATNKRKADYELAVNLAKKQRIYEVDPGMLLRFGSSLRAIQKDHPAQLKDNDFLCGIWLAGPPGSGKSRSARWLFPGAYPKPLNKWWDGYQGEPYIILDDMEPVHHVLGHHIKQWADHYPFTAEQKGTSIRIRPEAVVVTSNYTIDQIFSDPMMVTAIQRRFKVFEFK